MRSMFRTLLPMLAVAALAACADSTAPVGPDSTRSAVPVTIGGEWVYTGNLSFFSRIHLTVTRPESFDSTYLSGSIDADLRCKPGDSTFALQSTPITLRCHVLGGITDGRQTGNHVRLTVSFEGPMGGEIDGVLNPDGTLTGSIIVHANLDASTADGLQFVRP